MWEPAWADPLTAFLTPFQSLIHDQRTGATFAAIVGGILTTGTTVCAQIATHTPLFAASPAGAERVRRFVRGTSPTRSPDLDPDHLTARLREPTLTALRTAAPAEVWVILDGSELRKPYAKELPYLQKVPALGGGLVPGYATVNVIAVIPGYRGILYQRLFSSHEPGFTSISAEIQQALLTVGTALAQALPDATITWLMDRGFDDIAVWRTIWGLGQHLVCRVQHQERLVDYATAQGWRRGHLTEAWPYRRALVRVETTMEVRLTGQRTAKRQPVTVQLSAVRVRVSYDPADRRTPPTGQVVRQGSWAVLVRIEDCAWEPWVLWTDWPVRRPEEAQRVFQMYRQRWGIEDSLKFTKECVDWEAVQVLDLRGIRMLVTLAWVAAGFLYSLGISLEWEEVRLLARLGGWEERKDRPPGRIVLARGLARLFDMLATQAWLAQYQHEHGALPPQLAAFLRRGTPPGEL
jgi:hypothetical protein